MEDLPGVGDFITSNKLHEASSCTWCQWRRAMADTEEGSLNPDLRIREKGVLGKRTLPKGSPNEKCVLYFWKHQKDIIDLKERSIPERHLGKYIRPLGIKKVPSKTNYQTTAIRAKNNKQSQREAESFIVCFILSRYKQFNIESCQL